MSTAPQRPNDHAAREVVARFLKTDAFSLSCTSPGAALAAYEITTGDGSKITLRMGNNETRAHLQGSVYWTNQLLPLGVPLPRVLHSELRGPLPFTLHAHIAGRELSDVYRTLSPAACKTVAQQVADVQHAVHQLPLGTGFGYGFSAGDVRLLPTWSSFITLQIERARNQIAQSGVCTVSHVARVEEAVKPLDWYLASILPIPFLDNTTTKNVLIESSQLAGISGMSAVCFGDPIHVLARTNVELQSRGWSLEYVDHWARAWKLSERQHEAMRLYSAVMCIGLMGEIGATLRSDAQGSDLGSLTQLESMLTSLVGR